MFHAVDVLFKYVAPVKLSVNYASNND